MLDRAVIWAGFWQVLLILIAAMLCIGSAYALRSSFVDHGSIVFSGLNGVGVLIAFVFYVLISALLGPEFAISLIAALLLHETGQVLAYRMLGHDQTRFRLVRLHHNMRISDRPFATDGQEFFAAIMGSVFSLGPMVLGMAIAATLNPIAPVTAHLFWIFSVTCGALNFVSLLPFFPLAGGRCTRMAVANFWPALGPAMTVFMSAAMFTASLRTGSIALMVLAAVGVQSLVRPKDTGRTPMSADTGLIALAAYAFTMAAHFSAGWLLFEAYF